MKFYVCKITRNETWEGVPTGKQQELGTAKKIVCLANFNQ